MTYFYLGGSIGFYFINIFLGVQFVRKLKNHVYVVAVIAFTYIVGAITLHFPFHLILCVMSQQLREAVTSSSKTLVVVYEKVVMCLAVVFLIAYFF